MELFKSKACVWPLFAVLLVSFTLRIECSAYDPPNFDVPFVDRDALQLDPNTLESLIEALTSVACNFPESTIVDSDLKERSLALALCLNPLSVNARNAHRDLSRQTVPAETSFFKESVSSIAEKLWSTSGELSKNPAEPEALKLALYLRELSLLLHPAPPGSRINTYKNLSNASSQPWQQMVTLQPEDNPSSRKLEMLFLQDFSIKAPPAPQKPQPTTPPPTASISKAPTPPPPAVTINPGAPEEMVKHLIYLCDFESTDGSEDQSPRNNHGDATGVTISSGRGGPSSKAIRFQNKTQMLKLPIDLSPMEIPEATVCLWVKVEGNPRRNAEIVSQHDRGLDRAIVIEKKQDNPFRWGVFRGGDGVGLTDKHPMEVDQWTFVAATFSHKDTKTKLYVNKTVTDYNSCNSRGRSELFIGNGHPAKEFIGSIDDVCIFNRVLTRREIDSIRNGKQFARLITESRTVLPQDLQPNGKLEPAPLLSTTTKTISDGLVYACNFEESDGSIDQSPAGNHGIVMGAKRVAGVGKDQNAIYLNGDKDQVVVLKSLRPREAADVTISGWFKPAITEKTLGVPFSAGGGGNRGFQLRFHREKNALMWSLNCGAGGVVFARPVVFGQWTHVAAVYEHNSFRARMYINGQVYSSDNAANSHGPPFFILGRTAGFNNTYKGAIDNLLVYDRAMTGEEVVGLYKSTGPSAKFSSPAKISRNEGRVNVLPTYVANPWLCESRPNLNYRKQYVLGGAESRGVLYLKFDLSALEAQSSKFTKCHLEAVVADFEDATTTDPIVLSNNGVDIATIKGAENKQVLRFEIPVSSLKYGQPLFLKLRCGNDDVFVEKGAPNGVTLVF